MFDESFDESIEVDDQCLLRQASLGELLPECCRSEQDARDGLGGQTVDLFDQWFCMRCLSHVSSSPSTVGQITYERLGNDSAKNCPVYERRLNISSGVPAIAKEYPLRILELISRVRRKK